MFTLKIGHIAIEEEEEAEEEEDGLFYPYLINTGLFIINFRWIMVKQIFSISVYPCSIYILHNIIYTIYYNVEYVRVMRV